MRFRAAFEKSVSGFLKWLQHKSLLLFLTKKVIVAKIKLCSKTLHILASKSCDCGHYTTVCGIMQVLFQKFPNLNRIYGYG